MLNVGLSLGFPSGRVVFQLSPLQAWLACLMLSVCYVGSLFTLPARLMALPRSDLRQVKARMRAVLAASLASVWFLALLSSGAVDSVEGATIREWLGIARVNYSCLLSCLSTTACLFTGPLVCAALMMLLRAKYTIDQEGMRQRRPTRISMPAAIWEAAQDRAFVEGGKWPIARNLIVGPLTEELVYRACFIPLLLSSGVNRGTAIWCSPVLFGLSHVHHIRERLRSGCSVVAALLPSLVQLTYTTLFGAYAAFVFIGSSCLTSTVLVHSFCNCMGVPDLSFARPAGAFSSSGQLSALYSARHVIWACYLLGIGLFVWRLPTAASCQGSVFPR
ncbi:unnamed protein product [Chrysoparadoxa australica]